jgi:hypothetical protein
MSQQWEYRAAVLKDPTENRVNQALANWAANGWELVNGNYVYSENVFTGDRIWLFWRRAK